MSRIILVFCFLIFYASGNAQDSKQNRNRSFDAHWHFLKDSLVNADAPEFDDSKWRTVNLPHDWSIEDLPNQTPGIIAGPFNKNSIGKTSTGYTVGGTGWYRKEFVTENAFVNKNVTIHFDGVYMNVDVWLNGHHLGNHPYGYTPFYYDLAPYLNPAGKKNVLAVKVKNEGRNSRWYTGSGIYRHVWLTVTDLIHIAPWGVYITTPDVSDNKATVQLKTTVVNNQKARRDVNLITTIISPEGKIVGEAKQRLVADADASKTVEQTISITNAALWSISKPALYKAITQLKEGSKILDREETLFGIRTLSFTAEKGFLLNGNKVLLKGGCVHSDNGPLGAATIDRAEERKIEILKKNGFNAIRTSHNPPSKQFLDACDRLGMLVIDEAFDMWEEPKNPQDYHLYFKEWWKKDLDAMILRDRNHPSVIIWSIGNEIRERADSSGLRITKQLSDEARKLDPSRPVTESMCVFWERPGYRWDTTAQAFALLDVGGYNYKLEEYENDHEKYPERIMVGTESYARAALENWNMVEKHPYVIGDFVWTAFDYIGEASIGHATFDSLKKSQPVLPWPWFNGYCGDFDLIGNKKPQSYYRDVVWRNSSVEMMVHVPIPDGLVENISDWGWPDELKSWNWPGQEGRLMQVSVYTRGSRVTLELNGKKIDKKTVPQNTIMAKFDVPYVPGMLIAKSYEGGKQTGADTLVTAGKPVAIRLRAERNSITSGPNDLSYIHVEIIDEAGRVVPVVDDLLVNYEITGNGEIAGIGNRNPKDVSSFQQPEKKVYHGRGLVIIKPKGVSGVVRLKARADGLKDGIVEIHVR